MRASWKNVLFFKKRVHSRRDRVKKDPVQEVCSLRDLLNEGLLKQVALGQERFFFELTCSGTGLFKTFSLPEGVCSRQPRFKRDSFKKRRKLCFIKKGLFEEGALLDKVLLCLITVVSGALASRRAQQTEEQTRDKQQTLTKQNKTFCPRRTRRNTDACAHVNMF